MHYVGRSQCHAPIPQPEKGIAGPLEGGRGQYCGRRKLGHKTMISPKSYFRRLQAGLRVKEVAKGPNMPR